MMASTPSLNASSRPVRTAPPPPIPAPVDCRAWSGQPQPTLPGAAGAPAATSIMAGFAGQGGPFSG
ncbi:hypothetical protein O7623_25995 [Solwaraspora sp. WMMD791]|uniref:hypothetical protein n=1 Tax=Solwaraspora sp. WMMD791 TaxID=3016086 RepID=UPI00249C5B47|nr:hypothetical protein [Solwaraspora sp. WMMD791]WFE26699.1 hypothetical protein O7623_25995 [Solwaraspora sp. WMMD791]